MTKIEREKAVVGLMIAEYCKRRHGSGGELCPQCRELQEYALARLEHCPKGEEKSSCRRCEIHCYTPAKREQIRAVMRYMGPRMLLVDPLEAIRHLFS